MIAFITNSSFIDSRAFDGFRKCIEDEFDYAYVIDLGGDVRGNPKLSGSKHNVFGIQTGVAITFLIKKANSGNKSKCRILYASRPELETAKEKLAYLQENKFENISFKHIIPSKHNSWINQTEQNDFEGLLILANKRTKLAKCKEDESAVFKLISLGIVTARDEWVYDKEVNNLKNKVNYLVRSYNSDVERLYGKVATSSLKDELNYSIKWTRAVKNDLSRGKKYSFDCDLIVESSYRPFVKRKLYFSKRLNEMQYQLSNIFPSRNNAANKLIIVNVEVNPLML
jgi:predicted helicase